MKTLSIMKPSLIVVRILFPARLMVSGAVGQTFTTNFSTDTWMLGIAWIMRRKSCVRRTGL